MKPIKPGESMTIDFGSVIEKIRKGIKPDHVIEFELPDPGQPTNRKYTILLYEDDTEDDQ